MVGDTAGEGDTPLWLVRRQPFGNLRLIRRFSYSNAAKQQHRPARLNTGPRPRLSFRGFAWGTAGGEWWRGHSTLLRGRSRAGKPELRLVVARSMWEVAGTQHFVVGQNSGWKARATMWLRGVCYASWPGRVDRRTMRNRSAASRISTTATVAMAKSSESDSASCLSPMRIQPPAKAQVA